MKHLIQEWLDGEIDDDICVNDRELSLVLNGGRYEVWEDGELIAWNDNHTDFLNVGIFIGVEQAA